MAQVEGVGHQRHRRLRGDAHGGAELLGHERRHPRRAVTTERGIAVTGIPDRPASPHVAVPDSAVAGCWMHHW